MDTNTPLPSQSPNPSIPNTPIPNTPIPNTQYPNTPIPQPPNHPITQSPSHHLPWLLAALIAFTLLAGYQLGLPGLHYDEAKEAGINAMQLLTGEPVSAFRDASVSLFGVELPLMVQDYIGALNVYLSLPFLAATGIGVPNLRFLGIVLGILALLSVERSVTAWLALCRGDGRRRLPLSTAGLLAVSLLALSPSFVFWQRQGIFVTNATLPATFGAIWLVLTWARTGSTRALLAGAFAAGLALYAKLLAYWILPPFALGMGVWWLWQNRARSRQVTLTGDALPLPPLGWPRFLAALAAGMLPLLPFVLFNLQTGGTFQSVGENWGQSYYGVRNAAALENLPVRLGQLAEVLRGGQFWYLGGIHQNGLAPWLAGIGVLAGLLWAGMRERALPWRLLLPLGLLLAALLLSLFTVSDLFITHYALIHPLLAAVVGMGWGGLGTGDWGLGTGDWGLGTGDRGSGTRDRDTTQHPIPNAQSLIPNPQSLIPSPQSLIYLLLALWLILDLSASVGYHRDLGRSGGLADHSDASYHLAYHLRYSGLGAPIVLDWGMEAPVRYLSEGTVRPIEIFGYASLAEPDPDFALRLGQFLPNPDNVYLLRAEAFTVFQGRRQAFLDQARLLGRTPTLEITFAQRDGTPLFEVWRVE